MLLVMLLVFALMWVVDNYLNGFVVDRMVSLLGSAGLSQMKQWAAAVCVLLGALVTGIATLCAYNAAKSERRRFIEYMTDYLNRTLEAADTDDFLDPEFEELEAPLIRLRQEFSRTKQLAEIEMQRKSDLITYLAHDLKTPLASVIAYLNLLDEAPELNPEQRAKYIGITLDKAYRLESLIEELFDIVRFNLQKIVINEERVRLKLMMEQLTDEFYPLLLKQGKSIRLHCEDGLTLRGDADKLARVFNNILKNAAAYSDENTEILIDVKRRKDEIELLFINRGDPIPQAKQEIIFEKFYRLDSSRSTQSGGAGLGLAIAKEIVDAHHGRIAVSSNAERTIFSVTLPASINAPRVPAAP